MGPEAEWAPVQEWVQLAALGMLVADVGAECGDGGVRSQCGGWAM